MNELRRSTPHLRLTAAILVAMLAALAGSLDADGSERNRRGEALPGVLRLVATPGERSEQHPILASAALPGRQAPRLEGLPQGDPCSRAAARVRLDASRASGLSLLQTTSMPPPMSGSNA
jgi:hypothetical protein